MPGWHKHFPALALLAATAFPAKAAATLDILKLDPAPLQAGSPLVVVYRIGNTGAAVATFQLQLVVDTPSAYAYQTVAPGGSLVLNWGATVATPGSKVVTLHIWELTGARQIRECPSCPP